MKDAIEVSTPVEANVSIETELGPYTPTEEDADDLNNGLSINSGLESGVEVDIFPVPGVSVKTNDPLVLKMAGYILDHAMSADELHAAVDNAVRLIEANPRATTFEDIRSGPLDTDPRRSRR